jgi:hypothetical protein
MRWAISQGAMKNFNLRVAMVVNVTILGLITALFMGGADSSGFWNSWPRRYGGVRSRLVFRLEIFSSNGECKRHSESRHENERQRILYSGCCNPGFAGLFCLGYQRRSVAAATDWSKYAGALFDRDIARPTVSNVVWTSAGNTTFYWGYTNKDCGNVGKRDRQNVF